LQDALLGLDVGTSSLKAGLFTPSGHALGLAEAAYPLFTPEPGAMEQDPLDWWVALTSVCRQLLAQAPRPVRVLALAIGGQAPTLSVVDARLEPTHAAVTWLDQRPAATAEQLYARLGQSVPIWGSWPAQVAWFARERPRVLRRSRWLMGCPDFLAARLTGEPALFLAWPAAEVDAAEVEPRLLPPQRAPGDIVGSVSSSAAAATGLPVNTPVVAGFVDGIMGVLGSGVQQPGDACINSGTSGTVSVVGQRGTGYAVLDLDILGAATNTSGKALDWFAQRIARQELAYPELIAEAAGVPPGAGGVQFLPHLAGERAPELDPRSRGAWVGITLEHDRRHLLRAVLEGAAFGLRSLADWLVQNGAAIGEVRCVGGQARSAMWNQIKADVLNRPLLLPEVVEAAVVGAAVLAALAVGAYSRREDAVSAMVRIVRRFDPDPYTAARYDELYSVYRQLYPALRDVHWRLHDFAQSASRSSADKPLFGTSRSRPNFSDRLP
jgi:xylulokinase